LLLAGAALGVLAAPAMAADMAVKAPAPYPYLGTSKNSELRDFLRI
jgi:hypothetical protein